MALLDEKSSMDGVGLENSGTSLLPQHQISSSPRNARSPWRKLLRMLLIAIHVIIILNILNRALHYSRRSTCQGPERSIEERVKAVLQDTPLIDGHDDMPLLLRFISNNRIYNESFTKAFGKDGYPGQVDIPRLRKGGNGGAFWSVYWGCPSNMTDYSDAIYAPIVQATYQQIDLVNRLQAEFPDTFSPHVNSSTALAAFKKGQLISPMGIEGLHQIGNSVANLRHYYDLGVRYATLTHNCGNRYADAALWSEPFGKAPSYWGGVSDEGKLLINEMNRLGMIVDLSHTSVETQVDVLSGKGDWAGSAAPIIYSHSSAFSICPHPRNVHDHVLELVKKRNSIVMVNFAPDFISCTAGDNENGIPDFDPDNSTLTHVAEHVVYIGEKIGYEHVGLGSDFDGIPTTPRGLEDVSKYPDLVAELLRRGVSDEDAGKIVGGNLLRVWTDIDAVALKLQAKGVLPMEDDLKPLKFAGQSLPVV